MTGQQVRTPKTTRRTLAERVSAWQGDGVRADFARLLRGFDEQRLRDLTKVIDAAIRGEETISLPAPEGSVDSSADLLADAAAWQETDAPSSGIQYDLTEADVQLLSVELNGFRGSPQKIKVGFSRKTQPISAIIFGENGVGKSTIVDAIEFALQGRIGRSANFNSPLQSAIRSYASEYLPEVAAKLSNQAYLTRSVAVNRSGVLEASPRVVTPGFRLAPISLNRTDLQRFLDTEALERGSILLDYFPSDVDQIAMRPQEEVHRLKSEMTELRIMRSSLSTQLSALLGIDSGELAARDKFDRALREKVMNSETPHAFKTRGGWLDMPTRQREMIHRLSDVHNRLAANKKQSEKISEILNPIAHQRQTKILRPILAKIGTELSAAFNAICTEHPVDRIDVVFGESGPLSLDVVVRLSNGRNCFPQQLVSEAYKDLIALLFFTSVAKKAAERGQARILILDDVLQSIDANIRHAFMRYLLKEFADWQLIITVHDRLWREQLRELFRAYEHPVIEHEIHGWQFDSGPTLTVPGADELTSDLEGIIDLGQPKVVGALAGQLLESICDQLTRKMQLAIPRKDRYTLGDLWPPVVRKLAGSQAEPETRQVDSYKMLRNLTVHPDPMSWHLSAADAKGFANAVLALYQRVRCGHCRSWLQPENHLRCKCGQLDLRVAS